jgi:RNA-binding protein
MYLRGIARQLKTDVNVGKAGLSEGAIGHVQALLEQRELVKLRLLDPAAQDRKQAAADLAQRAGAALVDVVGRVLVLYRPSRSLPPERRLSLPD